MKNKWSNYALKDGKVQSSYIREYSNRKKIRKAGEAGNCDSNVKSGKKQEEVEQFKIGLAPMITNDEWVFRLRSTENQHKDNNESIRKENTSETYKEGRQGISLSDQGRCEAEERYNEIQNGEEEMKKEKESPKAHKKHEAKESKAYEKKEDKKESKKTKK